jgi:hypothetical protein
MGKPFPAADLIMMLRIINEVKEYGLFAKIETKVEEDDPRNRTITLIKTSGLGVLTNNLIWAFKTLTKKGDLVYDLVSVMLSTLMEYSPKEELLKLQPPKAKKRILSPPPKMTEEEWIKFQIAPKEEKDLQNININNLIPGGWTGAKMIRENMAAAQTRVNYDQDSITITYSFYANPINATKSPHLYRVGLAGLKTHQALDACTILVGRAAKDLCVKEILLITEEDHEKYPSIYPRVIIIPTSETPLAQFIEGLHLLLTEEEFELILDKDTCLHQPHGWTSVGIARNYIGRTKFDEKVGLCAFSISAEEGSWGPSLSFFWDAHPFAKDWRVKQDRGHLEELLVARWDQDGYRVDYGFFESISQRIILHPIALWAILGNDRPQGPKQLGIKVQKENVEKWEVKTTIRYPDYVNILARYGFLKNGLIDVSYY